MINLLQAIVIDNMQDRMIDRATIQVLYDQVFDKLREHLASDGSFLSPKEYRTFIRSMPKLEP